MSTGDERLDAILPPRGALRAVKSVHQVTSQPVPCQLGHCCLPERGAIHTLDQRVFIQLSFLLSHAQTQPLRGFSRLGLDLIRKVFNLKNFWLRSLLHSIIFISNVKEIV